jgi:hypothetical protein
MMKLGVPTVVLVTQRFEGLARSVIRARGADPGMMVVLPPTEESEYGKEDIIATIAEDALDRSLLRLAPGAVAEAPAPEARA